MTKTNMAPATAGALMTREVITASPETPVDELARLLIAHNIGGMPVVDAQGTILGMVSGFDVISKRGATAADVMSRGVVSVAPDASVEEIVGLMGLHGIRRVPVATDGRLAGIISRSDLLRHYLAARR